MNYNSFCAIIQVQKENKSRKNKFSFWLLIRISTLINIPPFFFVKEELPQARRLLFFQALLVIWADEFSHRLF